MNPRTRRWESTDGQIVTASPRDLQELAHPRRRDHPAHAHPRGEHLGEGPQVDHGLRVVGVQGRQALTGEGQLTVRVVLHHQHVLLPADPHQLGPAILRQRHPGGVLEVRDRVEQLDALALLLQLPDAGLDGGRIQAVLVQGHLAHIHLVALEHPQRPRVRGALREDDVARIAEQLGHQVQTHLGARGHLDLLDPRVRALRAHELGDQLDQRLIPRPRAVLQDLQTLLRDDPRSHLPQLLQRQQLQVRVAPGQGDDAGAHRDLEDVAHRRGTEAPGALGEAAHQPRVGAGGALHQLLDARHLRPPSGRWCRGFRRRRPRAPPEPRRAGPVRGERRRRRRPPRKPGSRRRPPRRARAG
ncbi:Uncharacterised protein [Rothia kristinae]|nr:Uncharacterised protein [Rothia kristinae]